ncbi:LysR family transcriptional regulator [Actinomadura macra]|uniref:LysR family transcriptional regulator n=1 Tax=Actinomadura macra TaxID=46164 RepID=UPI0008348D1F|nr:LysR family transcriptional regulator [Actinomadura macra]
MDLDLGAIRAFVAVADDRSFSDAAARLGLSQQAVSKRIAKLESDLGAALLARTSGGAEPTADGRSFLVSARALLDLADQAVERLHRRSRTFRVDVLDTRIASIELVRVFHESVPDVEIEIVTSDGLTSAAPALRAGRIDAFFGRAVAGLDAPLVHAPVYLEPLHLLAGRGHPLAGRSAVPISDLGGTTAWMPGNARDSEWSEFYRHLSADFAIGIDLSGPNFGYEHFVERIGSSDSVYSFIGEKTRIPWHPDVVRMPVVEPIPVYPWSLIWHEPNRHPVLPLLIAHTAAVHRPFDPGREWLPQFDRALFAPSAT